MAPDAARAGRFIAAALLVGLALRLGFALGYWQGKPLTHDEQEYLVYALNLAGGRGYTRELPGALEGPSVEQFSRAPLYPALLAGVFVLTGQPTDRLPASVPRSVQVVQALAGLVVIWLAGRLAARAAGPRAGIGAAWLAAVYPPLVWSGAYALSEAAYSPLVLCSAWRLGAVIDRRGGLRRPRDLRLVALAGAAAGLAALTRSAALAFILLAAAWLWWRWSARLAVACLLGAALVVLPWTFRNLATHGRLVLVAADGGINFWVGNHPLAMGEGDMAANPQIKAAHVAFRAPLAHLTPEEREPFYYRAAFRWIAGHPWRWLVLLGRKLFYEWVPIGPSYTLHSPRYYWATVLTYVPLLLAALLAMPRLVQAPTPPRALLLLVASTVLVGLAFFPHERFRIPVVDPSLCVAASAWLSARAGHR